MAGVSGGRGRRVAIYRSHLLPRSETFVRDQALALSRWSPVLVGERVVDGLDLSGLDVRAPYHGPPPLGQKVFGALARASGLGHPFVAAHLHSAVPDLVHAHFGFDGVEVWPLARRLGVPLVVTLHGSDITTHPSWFASGRGGRRWRAYPRRLAAMAADPRVLFVAVSDSVRDAALARGLPAGRVVVCRTGIDSRRFVPSGLSAGQREPVVLFVGRLVEKKGVAHLIRAMARVREAVPQARLVIGGDGPLRADLVALAGRLGGRVEFVGALDPDGVRRQLAVARVFCLPSVQAANGDAEGFGLVLLEAQASGVPVVTSARGGAREGIVEGVTGISFAEGDEAALARGIVEFLVSDALADRASVEGPLFVAGSHDVRSGAQGLETIYDRMLEAGSDGEGAPMSAGRVIVTGGRVVRGPGDALAGSRGAPSGRSSVVDSARPAVCVSVVITTYDAEAFVCRAVDSVLSQEGVSFEIVIVDDCSRDGTLDLLMRLRAEDPRIRVFSTSGNGGPSVARNLGIEEARGEWIAVLDADDAFAPGRLQAIVDAAAKVEAMSGGCPDVVLDGLFFFDAVAGVVTGSGPPPPAGSDAGVPYPFGMADYLRHNRAIEGELDWGLLKPVMRREFLVASGVRYPVSMRHGEDFAFMVSLLREGARCVLSPAPGYLYTRRSGAVSGRSSGMSRTLVAYDALAAHAMSLIQDPEVTRYLADAGALLDRAKGLRRLADAEFVSRALRRGDVVGLLRRSLVRPGFAAGMSAQLGRAVVRRVRRLRPATSS